MIQKHFEKIIVGTALTVAASVIVPIAKNTLRPLASAGIMGTKELMNRAKSAVVIAREEVEDIIAEAQFERMKKQFDRELESEDNVNEDPKQNYLH